MSILSFLRISNFQKNCYSGKRTSQSKILNKLAKKIHSIKFNSFINEIKILFFNIINSIVFSCDPSRYFNFFMKFTNFIKRSRIIKIEMILINVLACRWKLEQFPTIILVDCNSRTLYEISKCYKKIKMSRGITRENNRINYVKK